MRIFNRIEINNLKLAILSAFFAALFLIQTATAQPRQANNRPQARGVGQPEQVFAYNSQMPTGVTVSSRGRIFTNYPRWEDPVAFTVAEIVNGREVPFPDAAINRLDPARPGETFVSVQSVVVDPLDRLWIVDTGSINLLPIVSPSAPKLVCVDLATNRIVKTIKFTTDVVLPTTYLNDIRFDLRKGTEGVAYITDSSDKGPNAIIAVDLATGTSRRLLNGHKSVTAEPLFAATVEGKDLKRKMPGLPHISVRLGADGIAISADGARLFYCPLASRKLYSVATDALLNQNLTAAEVAATVRDEGAKPAADGLESDAEGRVYSTDYENNRIVRRAANGGSYETIAQVEPIYWMDTMAVAADGYLYFTANELHRQKGYNDGRDLRQKPYRLFRVKIDGTPVRLRR